MTWVGIGFALAVAWISGALTVAVACAGPRFGLEDLLAAWLDRYWPTLERQFELSSRASRLQRRVSELEEQLRILGGPL